MNQNSYEKTIEVLSNTQASEDLWDSFFDEEEPRRKIQYVLEGESYKIRLLGPFVKARRLYVNYNPFLQGQTMSSLEFKKILQGDDETYKSVLGKLNEISKKMPKEKRNREHGRRILGSYPNEPVLDYIEPYFTDAQELTPHNEMRQARTTLYKMFKKDTWQKCVLVNGLIRESSSVKVFVLNQTMLNDVKIGREYFSPEQNIPLTGINAHDMTFSRRGIGIQTKYTTRIDPNKTKLNSNELKLILSRGLMDIKSVIHDINRYSLTNNSSYFYKLCSEYKMSTDLYSTLFDELCKNLADESINDANDKLDSLPDEAFENREAMKDPINCLEI